MALLEEIIGLFNFIGSLVCHQRPDRTLWIGGNYLPVCARCTGAYLGLLLGYVLIPFLSNKEARGPPNLYLSLVLILPLWIDSIGQMLGFWSSTNDARLITGILFGVSLSPLLIYVLSLSSFSNRIPVLKRIKPEIAVLDEKNSWFNLKAQALSILLSGILFLTIRLMVGHDFSIFYWVVSTPIIFGIVLHFIVLPILLLSILIIMFISTMREKARKVLL
ncbi:MAG: DUF2085 domain-containing protein [Candidatus Brockarchaeota archaeon]|nr:DUF2085 domain-containing protein [Candidatus Brockarchaeota archaeon]